MQSELKKLESQGDQSSNKYKKLTKSIKEQKTTREQNKTSLEQLRRQQSLTSMTIEEMRRHSTQLRSALLKAIPGTENYKALSLELQKTRSRMRELEVQAKQTDNTLCGFEGSMRDYIIGAVTYEHRYNKESKSQLLITFRQSLLYSILLSRQLIFRYEYNVHWRLRLAWELPLYHRKGVEHRGCA